MRFFGKIFADRDGEPSFTRIAPAVCLVGASVAWVYGCKHPEVAAYCQQTADKLVEFAKWAFCVGKTAEQFRDTLKPKGGVV